MIEKQETIAATMRAFMASGPSTVIYPSYKSLNDAVGALHGLPAGKCQCLAGEKAWAWHADTELGVWRKATDVEFENRKAAAVAKSNGGSRRKVLSAVDRAALDAQVTALEAVDNPALAGLLADLQARQTADDAARKGSMKDRLQAAIDTLGLAEAVTLLEGAIAAAAEATAEA